MGDPYEVIYPTNEIPSTSVFQGGITRIGPGSYRTDSRFIQKSNQTLTVTGVYSNGQLNIVNNGTLIITALEFIDDVTL